MACACQLPKSCSARGAAGANRARSGDLLVRRGRIKPQDSRPLAPEQVVLALPLEMLRALPEEYVRSLPAEIQEQVRRRLQGATH
jgi:hypothetical protein